MDDDSTLSIPFGFGRFLSFQLAGFAERPCSSPISTWTIFTLPATHGFQLNVGWVERINQAPLLGSDQVLMRAIPA